MDTKTLESLLEAGGETQSLDFKASCPWNAKSFVKDILAMTNIQDGGRIVIGVNEEADGSYRRTGVKESDRKSYKKDIMADQVSPYADPHAAFSVEFPSDADNRTYVVITVEPFREVPVLCKKDGEELKAGALYFRNRNRRIESGQISNAYDMRDVIERAAVKLAQRARILGYVAPDTAKAALDKELGDL